MVDNFHLCETIVMKIQYRTMSISDHTRVSDLWSSSDGIVVRTSDSEEHIAKYLSRNHGLSFVAESHGDIVGSILAGHDGKRGYIQHLIVSPKFRSTGIGSQLVALCLSALSDSGILKSHIHVLEDNANARNFWTKHGWNLREDIVVYSYINSTDRNI